MEKCGGHQKGGGSSKCFLFRPLFPLSLPTYLRERRKEVVQRMEGTKSD